MKKSGEKETILRVVTTSPVVHIGNVKANVEEIKKIYSEYQDKADVILTPELSLTGYTCQDLFENRYLINEAKKGLISLARFTKAYGVLEADDYWMQTEEDKKQPILIVGLPMEVEGSLWNCAAVIHSGCVLGIVPKTYLPNYGEFYEKRWFSAGEVKNKSIELEGFDTWVHFGNNLLFRLDNPDVTFGVEICEDVWSPIPPSRLMAVHGAEVIFNLSASNEVIGKESYRKHLIGSLSASCICGYVYASAGLYESTSDVVFSGHKLVYVSGRCVGEKKPFEEGDLICDIQLTKIKHDRFANKTFSDCKKDFAHKEFIILDTNKTPVEKEHLLCKVPMTPFVPSSNKRQRALSIFRMQVAGLERRLLATRSKHVVIGISGGLDSTLALLVAAKAVKNVGLPASTVIGITMPGFGTTSRTKNNSIALMEKLGCEIRTVSIVDSVRQHFKDIGHDEAIHDITYENCQARERTQILMDVANKEGGFVIGTGDLSELCLGWCTYNGDHMSMYGVNNSIPKTLVRTLVDEIGHELEENGFEGIAPTIEDIIDTPVSPELLPPNADGTIAQKTEDTIGSYILHDFFIYYTLRYGMAPSEVFKLCKEAVYQSEEYKFKDEDIIKCMKMFYRRFFMQQFKRNCMPDGVKVGTVSVSPRGDLRLPSEIEFSDWVEEVERIAKQVKEYSKEELIAQAEKKEEVDYVFFWGHTEKGEEVTKACLSQWYPCEFNVDGECYYTAEQYMMAQKALLFEDDETYFEIMSEKEPKQFKALGRKIKGFDHDIWNKNKVNIVVKGNVAKFSQNKKLKDFLLSTGDKVLVEASPEDIIWGIGFGEEDSEARNPRAWKGENLMGFALMEVRDMLR